MFEGLKAFITAKYFSLVGFAVAVFFLISGVIFSGIAGNLRLSERGKFDCVVPDSLENKKIRPLQCINDYDQKFNSVPLYGFILLSCFPSVLVCVIYSCCVKSQVEGIETDSIADVEDPRPRPSRRVFRSYLLQLLARFVLGVIFALLQKVVLYPSDFPAGFLCDSSPKPAANATDNASTSALIGASRINCYNSVGSEKTSLALALWIVNILFTVILFGEIIYLAVRVWKRREFMSDSEFYQEYFFKKNQSPPNDQNTSITNLELKPQIKTFISSMKERVLGNKDIAELKPLIARNPGEQLLKNRALDDMYVKLTVHSGRAIHDFNSAKDRHEILSSEYVKPRHGSVAIDTLKDLFLRNKDTAAGDPLKIIIIGRPGIGKSLLCNKLMHDWAKDEQFPDVNKSFEMAFLFKFRLFNFEKTEKQCLQTLLSKAACSGNIDKESLQYALDNPKKVLLVFDGLDEFKYHTSCLADEEAECENGPEDVMRTSTLYAKLVKGELLPGATVVTTCRPNVVGSLLGLDGYIDRTVEIMGFTPEKVHEYVQRFCEDDSDAINRISGHIESNLNLLSLCYIPATCVIICNILLSVIQLHCDQQDSGTQIVLPTTLTKVYQTALKMFVWKHHPEYQGKQLTIKDLSSKVRFAVSVEETLKRLGSLARHGTDQRRLIFKEKEVQGMEDCGLLNRMPDTVTENFEVDELYCFIHLTLQEFLAARDIVKMNPDKPSRFLAARDIVKMNPDEPSRFISSHAADPKWHLVIQFVAGLLRDQQNQKAVDSIVNLLRDSLTTNWDQTMALLMMNCLYELNDDTAANTAATQLQASDTFDNTVKFARYNITAVDCTAVAYFLKHMEQLQELDLSANPNIGDGGCKEIAKLLREGGPKQLNLSLCSITDQGVLDLCEAMKQQHCKLSLLYLATNNITDKGVSGLCEALKNQYSKLTHLKLPNNLGITDKGVSDLCEALKNQYCKLKHLNLCNITISDIGVLHLCKALTDQHCELTQLELDIQNKTPDYEVVRVVVSHLCEAAAHENFKLRQLILRVWEVSAREYSSQGKQKLQNAFADTGCDLLFYD